MTKATIPEPAAWMLAIQTMGGDVGWKLSWTQSGAGVCHRLSGESHEKPLITTTQAQAYADARVREALEEALTVVADEQKSLCDDDHELGWSDCADTIHKNIRALIPTPPTEKP